MMTLVRNINLLNTIGQAASANFGCASNYGEGGTASEPSKGVVVKRS